MKRYRILRSVGSRLVNVGIPGMTDALTIHAANEATALMRAHLLVADTRGLVAVSEMNQMHGYNCDCYICMGEPAPYRRQPIEKIEPVRPSGAIAISSAFAAARSTVAQLEAERDSSIGDWSPAQARSYRRAA